MNILMTTGLSSALLSAKTHYSAAVNPMRQASDELRSFATDFELLDRSLEYGTRQMFKAEQSTIQAGIELKKAQVMSRKEFEILQENRLEERRQKNSDRVQAMYENSNDSSKNSNINSSSEKDNKDEKKNSMYSYNENKKTMWAFLDSKSSNNGTSIFSKYQLSNKNSISNFLSSFTARSAS